MPFVNCAEPPANCADSDGSTRSLASRLWHDYKAATPGLRAASTFARSGLSGRAGRVESSGTLEHAGIELELRRALPEALALFTTSKMEWYGCCGAFFHNDAHYGGVLFGVWSIDGPPREIVFPRIGKRLPAGAGNIIVFDPFEPHAVLDAGSAEYRREDYETAAANLFLGFEVALSTQVRAAFDIGEARAGCFTLSSRVAINPETGAVATSAA
jgi:hypothetical protein